MKAKPEVIAALDKLLGEELTAVHQYMLHSEICRNWGYKRLHKAIKHRAIEEMEHSKHLIDRLLLLDWMPNVARAAEVRIGSDVPKILANDLALERQARDSYNDAIRTCMDAGDAATADILTDNLHDEERHIEWLERQLDLIQQAGLQSYLSEQFGS